MAAFLRSDLFRNFMGGFLVGAVCILALAPADQTAVLMGKITAIYSTIA